MKNHDFKVARWLMNSVIVCAVFWCVAVIAMCIKP